MRFLGLISVASLVLQSCNGLSVGGGQGRRSHAVILDEPEKRQLLQDLVTWDEHSLFIRGERVMIFSGEFHPFRLPVPSLYLDVFQKIKALGFNAVSFYVHWALLEGKPGHFSAEGIFDLKPFFDAATKAGIYLIARPGPYINAEVSGGGFPGWLQRVTGYLRTSDPEYLAATDNYMANICKIIADAQITNGGPIILFQPENEYTAAAGVNFPDPEYFQYVIDQARNAGVVVPIVNNDARPEGHNAPGTGLGSVDIYAHDGYPVGFDCANPYDWPAGFLPTNYHALHMRQSPTTPFSLLEFQGGAFDPYGGWGYEQCSVLVNHEFERVFYKNNMAAGVTIFNVYMIFGGTNWGNLGHPGVYTSYDYGAAIQERRTVTREKYSELKLEAQFLKVSPGYMIATPGTLTRNVYSNNTDITITPLLGNGTGSFFVVRHSDYANVGYAEYTLRLPTSEGTLTVPQLGGSLLLNGRDSKIHVTDYRVGNTTLLYSTAEILTWKKFQDKTVLIVYGGLIEIHEIAIKTTASPVLMEGGAIRFKKNGGLLAFQWETSETRRVVKVDDLVIYLLDRNAAYNYWVPDLPGDGDQPGYGTSLMNPDSIIINGGYLVRSVSIENDTLYIKADFNQTTPIEIIGVPTLTVTKLVLNDDELDYTYNSLANWVAQPRVLYMKLYVPDLSKLDWKYIDSLPEIQSTYDDSAWPVADHRVTNNSVVPLFTPVSLYGSDYGFHTGTLVFRGHFTAGCEGTILNIITQGGSAFATSIWVNSTFIGSFEGNDAAAGVNGTLGLPNLVAGKPYVLTVVVDTNGLNQNWVIGWDDLKLPRGILEYSLLCSSGEEVPISPWKITGNLGGEDYADHFRGPLNEGGLFFERQGYHLPSPSLKAFTPGSPFNGIDGPGVAFYAAPLELNYPSSGFDIPISFSFENSTEVEPYRALLFVNGFQFGKYASNIGPQTDFPVPEGILRYQGKNWIGLSIWALGEGGARVPNIYLNIGPTISTGRELVTNVDGSVWSARAGAY